MNQIRGKVKMIPEHSCALLDIFAFEYWKIANFRM